MVIQQDSYLKRSKADRAHLLGKGTHPVCSVELPRLTYPSVCVVAKGKPRARAP